MTATGEGEVPAVEQPVEEAPAPEQPKQAEKPVKEKKPRVPKEKKLEQPKVAHPPYFQMIEEALLALDEKGGSSPYAIAKYMEEKHKAELPANFRKILALQIKNSAARGKLIKIKASYKLSEVVKKDKGTAKVPKAKTETNPKQAKATKVDAPKTRAKAVKKPEPSPAKKVVKAAKKPKKSAPAKPKQPKSIKSPAAKRAKRVAA